MNAANKARTGTAKERSVFVGNIPYDVTEEMLKEIFSEAGSVINFRLVTDRETGKPKGYGFCEYADGATALSAMRNLNGYEINGRNLRVDFADGGDKSNSNNNNNNSNEKNTSSVSGEVIIHAIENAISRFGPLKLYDMLLDLKEHARQRPDYTKSILTANPALTHAIVQCFKTLNIPIPASTETQPALLSAPPPLHHAPPHLGRPLAPPPQRSSLNGAAGGGGILGMAPPGPPPMSMAPPPAASAKAGGTRWSARPGPLAGLMPAPAIAGPPVQPAVPSYQGPPPPLMAMPPPPGAQIPMQAQQVSRDPRRARDPRLAKRSLASEPTADAKRSRPDEHQHPPSGPNQGNGTFDAIAELARDMTPQKLNMLPPNERQILMILTLKNGIFPVTDSENGGMKGRLLQRDGMDKLAQLQATLRAIEAGTRLESVDAILVRQVLHRPPPPQQQKQRAAPIDSNKCASLRHVEGTAQSSGLELADNVSGKDAYRALLEIRKRKKKEERQESQQEELNQLVKATKSPVKGIDLGLESTSLAQNNVNLAGHHPGVPDAFAPRNAREIDAQYTDKEMRVAIQARGKELLHSQKQVEEATTELQALLSQSQSLLPSQFLFERNLTEFCQERSVEVIQHVLLRFQHRFYRLYFAQWRIATLALRRVAHQRAAAAIVRVYRGHRARKHAGRLRKQLAERELQAFKLLDFRIKYRTHQAQKIQMVWRRFLRSQAIKQRQKRKQSAIRLQKLFRNRRLKKSQLVNTFLHVKSVSAAIRIQKLYRGHRARVFVREVTRRGRRAALVAATLARNVSKEALIQWKLDRQGAAFLICNRVLYPYAVKRRLRKLVYLTRRLQAAQIIARRVCEWFGVSARRQAAADQQLKKWLHVLAIEQKRTRAAAVRIQKNLRRWVQQRKYIMEGTRRKKLARKQRLAEKQIRLQASKASIGNGAPVVSPPVALMKKSVAKKGAPKLVNALRTIARKDSKRLESDDGFAKRIQRCYRRHSRYAKFARKQWREEARQVEARVLQRRRAAIGIQTRVRGIQARKVFRRMKAEKLLYSFVLKWKWNKIVRFVQAANRIYRWLEHKRTQRLARLWRLERKQQHLMAAKLQRCVRRHVVFRCRMSVLLGKVRKREETQLFCRESLRVCTQHLTDELIFDSLSRPFEDAMRNHLHPQARDKVGKKYPTSAKQSPVPRPPSAPSFPLMQMVFLVVSGAKDSTRWKDMDEKTLLQTKLERSRVVALFKAANKHYQETGGSMKKSAKSSSRGSSPKTTSKTTPAVAHGAFFSMTDVDLALAKAGGASKRALTFDEFGHVLRLMGEIKLTRVTMWWSKYDGSDAQLFALLWDFILVLPEMSALVQLLAVYVLDVMNKRCRRIQQLFQRESNLKRGLFLRLRMRKQLELEAKARAATRLQAHVRSFAAKTQHKRRIQQVYEKYIDPEWGLPYWVNPKTGFSTWEKPRALRAEDVRAEVVPYPPQNLTLKIPCEGKPECGKCAEWHCYDCEAFFCVVCLPAFHKDKAKKSAEEESTDNQENESERDEEQQKSRQSHEMEQIPLCGLCQFQVASRKCLDCLPKPDLKKKRSLVSVAPKEPPNAAAFSDANENGEREALFCDVCFAYMHRRGGLQVHRSNPLLEMCTTCTGSKDEEENAAPAAPSAQKAQHTSRSARAAQWQCEQCEKKRVCGKCVSVDHPVELCGVVKRVPLQTLQMIEHARQIAEEIEARDRADVEKMRLRALQTKREGCAARIQRFWRVRVRILRAKHIVAKLKQEKQERWLQIKADAAKERQFVYLLRNFLGIAKPLGSDTAVRKKLREMNVLQRRQLTIRARMFGLLPHEYMRIGIPLPGIGRTFRGSKEIDTTEDLRGWVKNRQTIRLKLIPIDSSMKKGKALANVSSWHHLANWKHEEDASSGAEMLVDVDAKEKLTERKIPLAQPLSGKGGAAATASGGNDDEQEEVEQAFVMYLVEFSMDPKRIVWINHSLAERFWTWKRLRMLERKEKRQQKREALERSARAAAAAASAAPLASAAQQPKIEPSDTEAKATGGDEGIDSYAEYGYHPNDLPAASTSYGYADSSPTYNNYEYGYGYDYNNGTTAVGEAISTEPLVDSSNYFYAPDGNSTAWQGYEYDQNTYGSYAVDGYYDANATETTAATDPYYNSATQGDWNGYYEQQQAEGVYSPAASQNDYPAGGYNAYTSGESYASTAAYQSATVSYYDYTTTTNGWDGDAAVYPAQDDANQWYGEAAEVTATPTTASALGSVWEEVFDPQTSQVYYVNRITQETAWQIPATY